VVISFIKRVKNYKFNIKFTILKMYKFAHDRKSLLKYKTTYMDQLINLEEYYVGANLEE
jgi:hypothetical protein